MTVQHSRKFPILILSLTALWGVGQAAAQENVLGDRCVDAKQTTLPLGETLKGSEADAVRRIFGLEGDAKVKVRMITTPTGIVNLTVVDANDCLVAADSLTYGDYATILGVRTILDEHFRKAEEGRLPTEPADRPLQPQSVPEQPVEQPRRDRHAADQDQDF